MDRAALGTKATDPGMLDNLIGGGVPAWPDAGAGAGARRLGGGRAARRRRWQRVRAGGVLRLQRDIAEGLQLEWLHAYDLRAARRAGAAQPGRRGRRLTLLPVDEALALAAGEQMTVDAALVTLDFALRHALLPDATRRGALEAGAGPAARRQCRSGFLKTRDKPAERRPARPDGTLRSIPCPARPRRPCPPPRHATTTSPSRFHWLLALMIVGSFCVGLYMSGLPFSIQRVKLFNWHKWAGMTILALTLLRLLWRLRHAPPPDMPGPHWQQLAAKATHRAMYVLFFAIPLVGWAYSSAAGFQIVVFGVLPMPNLMHADKALAESHQALARLAGLCAGRTGGAARGRRAEAPLRRPRRAAAIACGPGAPELAVPSRPISPRRELP